MHLEVAVDCAGISTVVPCTATIVDGECVSIDEVDCCIYKTDLLGIDVHVKKMLDLLEVVEYAGLVGGRCQLDSVVDCSDPMAVPACLCTNTTVLSVRVPDDDSTIPSKSRIGVAVLLHSIDCISQRFVARAVLEHGSSPESLDPRHE